MISSHNIDFRPTTEYYLLPDMVRRLEDLCYAARHHFHRGGGKGR